MCLRLLANATSSLALEVKARSFCASLVRCWVFFFFLGYIRHFGVCVCLYMDKQGCKRAGASELAGWCVSQQVYAGGEVSSAPLC